MVVFPILLGFILTGVLLGVWAERKVSAFIQDRLGPNEVGPKGLLQVMIDGIKLLQKEDIVPAQADRKVFLAAPVVLFVSVMAAFATMPLAPNLIASQAKVGVFYLIAILSIDVLGFLLAGWSSNNKFSVLGAMRAVAQIISYEIPMALIILAVVMIAGSLDLQEIAMQQGILYGSSEVAQGEYGVTENYLFGLRLYDDAKKISHGISITNVGGILSWNIIRFPLLIVGLLLFFIASLAESNRAPFDIPEGESEIIAGFFTEYSGFRWSIFMLTETATMFLVAFLGSVLFLGGWNTPLPNIGGVKLATWTTGEMGALSGYLWGMFWLFLKVAIWVFVQMWVRWSFPRLRVDQLMYLCWKVLTPSALIIVFAAGVWKMLMI